MPVLMHSDESRYPHQMTLADGVKWVRRQDAEAVADRLSIEAANLRHALSWALAYIADDPPESGEQRENYTGAQRLAWPDNPEEWDGE